MTQVVLDRVTTGESSAAASAPPRGWQVGQSRAGARPAVRPVRSRPGRGSGRGARPVLRPTAVCPPPTLASGGVTTQSRGCLMPAQVTSAPALAADGAPTWRLTDRGVAVVLVVGLMIMVAAATVVGLTAVRVTGSGYQATVSTSLPR